MTDIPSGYTPGPWKIHPVDDTTVIDATGAEVAAIDGDYNDPDTWPLMEANARLIALAPEMADEIVRLRALNAELLEGLNTIAAWHDGPKVSGHFDEPAAASVARALIAKAEGRT